MPVHFDQPDDLTETIFFDPRITPWELVQKVKRSKKSNVVVVIPPHHPLLQSAIATAYLVQALKCKDRDVRFDIADRAGRRRLIAAGAIMVDARNSPTNHPFRMPRTTHRKSGVRNIGLATLSLVVIMVFLFTHILPRATIVIIPEVSMESAQTRAVIETASSDRPRAAEQVRGKLLEESSTFTTSSEVRAAGEAGTRAQGIVRIVNQTGSEIKLAQGTVLLSDEEIQYVLDSDTLVPPAVVDEENDIRFGNASIAVSARDSGEKGNKSQGRLKILTLPANKWSRVYAEIATPITGGITLAGKFVQESDVAMVRATLESKLKDAFLEKFQQTEPIGWKVFAELMSATTSEVVVLPPVGATSDNFSVALTGKAQAIALSQDDLINLFGLNQQTCRLAENRPRCKFTIAGVKAIDFVKGKATAVVRLEKSVYPVLYHDDIKQEAAGKSLAQARQLILSDPYIKDVHIRLSMGLLGLIPKDVSKIRVEVEE